MAIEIADKSFMMIFLKEWPELFGDPLLASAGLDRLTHGAHILVITGASFTARHPRRLKHNVHADHQVTVDLPTP